MTASANGRIMVTAKNFLVCELSFPGVYQFTDSDK